MKLSSPLPHSPIHSCSSMVAISGGVLKEQQKQPATFNSIKNNASNPVSSSHPSFLDLNVRLTCPDCRNPVPNIVEDFSAGDMICGDCGIIIGNRIIDTRSEWRTFSGDSGVDDPSRVGGPINPLLDSGSLDTIISTRDGGSGLSKEISRTQTKNTLRASDRNLQNSFKAISAMAERVNLPKIIVDRAKQLCKMIEEEKKLRGKPNDGIIAACIYIACREEKVPRTFKEISSLTRVSKKDIGRCYKAIAPYLANHLGCVTTEDFMTRFCSHLKLPSEVHKAAVYLVKKASELGYLAGKSPISVAAAAIYLVTLLFPKHKKSAKDISYVAGVSEVTIKNTFKDIHPHRHSLVPPGIASKEALDEMPLIS